MEQVPAPPHGQRDRPTCEKEPGAGAHLGTRPRRSVRDRSGPYGRASQRPATAGLVASYFKPLSSGGEGFLSGSACGSAGSVGIIFSAMEEVAMSLTLLTSFMGT